MFNLKEEMSEPLPSVVKRLGNPESTTLLHASCSSFQIPEVDGMIAYQQIGNCVVVIGDPLCLPQDIETLTKAFHFYCQENNLRIVYLLVCHDFAHWAINNGCRTLIQVGEELSINPINFQKRQKLRWKTNQSIRHGVRVKEYKSFDPSLQNRIQNTLQTWLKQRHGPQIHLGNNHFFNNKESRIFYAEQNDKIIGLLTLFPIDRFQGWAVSSYLAIAEAPVGTTEHLMCSTFDFLAKENCSFLCLGAVSGPKLGEMIGLGFVGKSVADLIFKTAKWIFKLDAKAIYLNKYQPNLRSTFLLFKDKLSIVELLALKHILNVRL